MDKQLTFATDNPNWPKRQVRGPVVPGNIDTKNRPRVKNPDGTISTVRTISIGTDEGEVLIPTVVGDKVVSDKEAIEHYKKTRQHFGVFRTPDEATKYAKDLHNEQAKMIKPK
jgi:hypothetical protein